VAIVDNGAIVAAGGTLTLAQAVTGTGSLAISGTSTLETKTTVASSNTVVFDNHAPAGQVETLKVDSTSVNPLAQTGFAATISGIAGTDVIDLANIMATGAVINASNQLVVSNGSTTVAMLQLTVANAGEMFTVTSDGGIGSNISIAPSGTLTGTLTPIASKEGAALPTTTEVASFTDTNTSDAAGAFAATITWGNGTQSAGTVSGSNGSFTVARQIGVTARRQRKEWLALVAARWREFLPVAQSQSLAATRIPLLAAAPSRSRSPTTLRVPLQSQPRILYMLCQQPISTLAVMMKEAHFRFRALSSAPRFRLATSGPTDHEARPDGPSDLGCR
jgi:hypothetical protein